MLVKSRNANLKLCLVFPMKNTDGKVSWSKCLEATFFT